MKGLTIILVAALSIGAQGQYYSPFGNFFQSFFQNPNYYQSHHFVPCAPGTYRPGNNPTAQCVACTTPDPSCVAPGVWNATICICECPRNFVFWPQRRICVCNITSCVSGQPVNTTTCTCPP